MGCSIQEAEGISRGITDENARAHTHTRAVYIHVDETPNTQRLHSHVQETLNPKYIHKNRHIYLRMRTNTRRKALYTR